MAVFTAPERISVPTTTTKMWKTSRATNGPVQAHGQAADQVLEDIAAASCPGMIITAKNETSEVNTML